MYSKAVHLVQNVFIEVGHVSLTGHGTVVIVSEVLLESRRIVRDPQNCVKIMRQDLQSNSTHLNIHQWS